MDNSPANLANIIPDDIFFIIDNQNTKNMSIAKAISLITGKPGTDVKITIQRSNQLIDFILQRKKINISTINKKIFEINEKKIGYIKIPYFNEIIITKVKKEIIELEKLDIDDYIFDLRFNPGGKLNACIELVNFF